MRKKNALPNFILCNMSKNFFVPKKIVPSVTSFITCNNLKNLSICEKGKLSADHFIHIYPFGEDTWYI